MIEEKSKFSRKIYANQESIEKDFWVNQLREFYPENYIPFDFIDKNTQETANFRITYKPEEIVGLKNLFGKTDEAIYIILLTGLYYTIERYSCLKDIVISAPIYKQTSKDNLLNTVVPIRHSINEDFSLRDAILDVKDNFIKAYENANYPIDILFEQLYPENSNFSLFDIISLYRNIHDENYINEYDYNLLFVFEKKDNNLFLDIRYKSSLYKESKIIQITKYFTETLSMVFEKLNTNVKNLDFIPAIEKETLLYGLNNTALTYPVEKTIHKLFEEQVIKSPNEIAVISRNKKITYKELNDKANQLAIYLTGQLNISNEVVAILLNRSVDIFISMLGILKAGAFYLPLDPIYPEKRLKHMIDDSKANYLISEKNLISAYSMFNEINIIDINSINDNEISKGGNLPEVNPKSLAYLIYTSGSTGKPKGIMIEHRNVINFIEGTCNNIPFPSRGVVLCLTTICFDIFVLESFLPLLKGMRIIIADEKHQASLDELKVFIKTNEVNIIQITPSRLRMFLECEEGIDIIKSIKLLLVGGELFPNDLLLKLKTVYTGKLYNMYGPTETTVWSTIKDLSDNTNLNIGKPIANTQVYIIDKENRLSPMGEVGELCIGGDGLARAYWKRDSLTLGKFINNPYIENDIIYRTGDLANWIEDGNLDIKGRLDSQVKIRGYRIELKEIEQHLLEHQSIKQAVVIDKEQADGERILVSYIIAQDSIEGEEIKEFLLKNLPDYMIPSHFIFISQFPLTPNGKIDKNALPQLPKKTHKKSKESLSNTEKELINIFAEILKCLPEDIDNEQSFLEQGVNSLKALVIVAKVNKEFNSNISVEELYNAQSVKYLAGFLEGAGVELVANGRRRIVKVEKRDYYYLSIQQEQIYYQYLLNENSIAYNVPSVLKLEGEFKKESVAKAFTDLIKCHKIFEVYFEDFEDKPIQRFKGDDTIELEEIEGENIEKILSKFVRPFNLKKWPLYRLAIAIDSENNYYFISDMHHIISDEISINILINEFCEIYSGKKPQKKEIDYFDYIGYQNKYLQSEQFANQKEYWLNKFNDNIPSLNLPYDFEEQDLFNYDGDSFYFSLEHDDTNKIKELSIELGVTPYVFLLGVINILYSKICNQDDIVIGAGFNDRNDEELQKCTGIFVNTVLLRNSPENDKTFKEFINEVRINTLKAMQNQNFSIHDIKKEIDSDLIIRSAFVYQNIDFLFKSDSVKEIKGTKFIRSKNMDTSFSKFDLSIYGIEKTNEIEFCIEYKTQLFEEATIKLISEYFIRILNKLFEDTEIKLGQIELNFDDDDDEGIDENELNLDFSLNLS